LEAHSLFDKDEDKAQIEDLEDGKNPEKAVLAECGVAQIVAEGGSYT